MSIKNIILLAVLVLLAKGDDFDPCVEDNHEVRYDEFYRSASYITEDVSRRQCDDSLYKKWYRFISNAGNNMPDFPPSDVGSCGTTNAIWLSDPIADIDEIQYLKVCLTNGPYICVKEWNIHVKKCEGFVVYEFTPTDDCPQSYCIGNFTKCPEEESSENGFSPGCRSGEFPVINGSVTIEPTIEYVDSWEQVTMTCNIEEQIETRTILYDVIWTTEKDKEIKRDPYLNRDQLPAKLYEMDWLTIHNLMGQNLRCKIRGRYDEDGLVGPQLESYFFIGIRVLTPSITVYKSSPDGTVHPAIIQIQPTVPILCQTSGSGCQLSIMLAVPMDADDEGTDPDENPIKCNNQTIDDIVFETEDCNLGINASDWNDVHNISVYPADLGFYYSNNVRYRVELEITDSMEHMIWAHYLLYPINVLLINDAPHSGDKATSYCRVSNDPHYTTIDGRLYDSHILGEFVLYRHLTLPIQVHGYFEPCPGNDKVTCVCGGAVQSGGDVFVYDKCRHDYPQRIRVYSCEDQSLRFNEVGKDEYEVRLPTGADVFFGQDEIRIHPAEADNDQTQGMCGTFNLDCTDEFYMFGELKPLDGIDFGADCGHPRLKSEKTTDFSTSWQVEEDDSLYNGTARNFLKSWKALDIQYCTCSKGKQVTCGYTTGDSEQPCIDADNDRTDDMMGSCLAKKRRKRNADSPSHFFDDDVEDEVGDFPYRDAAPLIPDTTWKNGWNGSSALDYCTEVIFSSGAYKAIKDIHGVDVAETIQTCVLDIQLSGDVLFTQVHLSSLISTGARFAQQNMSLWHVNDDTGSSSPPDEILDQVCPADCNNKGQCVEGKCLCNANFTGMDCSISKNAVPKLFNLPASGVCDKSTRPCSMTPVYADVFFNSEKLTCHFKHYLFIRNEKQPGLTYSVPGGYSHSQKVFCNFPVVDMSGSVVSGYEFVISVSNDGMTPSDEKSLIVFDSMCMNCTHDGECNQEANTCFIDNNCFLNHAESPIDPCQFCDSQMDNDGWTRTSSEDCNEQSGLGVWAAAGIAVACVAALAAIAAAGVVVGKRKNRNKVHDEGEQSEDVAESAT